MNPSGRINADEARIYTVYCHWFFKAFIGVVPHTCIKAWFITRPVPSAVRWCKNHMYGVGHKMSAT